MKANLNLRKILEGRISNERKDAVLSIKRAKRGFMCRLKHLQKEQIKFARSRYLAIQSIHAHYDELLDDSLALLGVKERHLPKVSDRGHSFVRTAE